MQWFGSGIKDLELKFVQLEMPIIQMKIFLLNILSSRHYLSLLWISSEIFSFILWVPNWRFVNCLVSKIFSNKSCGSRCCWDYCLQSRSSTVRLYSCHYLCSGRGDYKFHTTFSILNCRQYDLDLYIDLNLLHFYKYVNNCENWIDYKYVSVYFD